MKITTISDTHARHSQVELEGGDMLIHAGDVEARNKEMLINFLGWFQKQPYKHKIFIAGNHDDFIQNSPGQAKYIIDKYDVHYLQDNYITINDIRIWGSPWSLEFGGWSWMRNEYEMNEYVNKIPHEIIDIFVSHGPPLGILDRVEWGENVGSEALRLINPKYFICGHIHECGGREKVLNDTRYINASVVNRTLDVVNKPITFKYN